jgi:hypothetical protein
MITLPALDASKDAMAESPPSPPPSNTGGMFSTGVIGSAAGPNADRPKVGGTMVP